MDLGLIITW